MKAVLLKAEKQSFQTKDGKTVSGEQLTFLDIERFQLWRKFITNDKLAKFDTVNYLTNFLQEKVFLLDIEASVVQGYDGKEKMVIAGISALSKGR
jgi:hypothetical protein